MTVSSGSDKLFMTRCSDSDKLFITRCSESLQDVYDKVFRQ